MHILVETICSLRLVHKKQQINENANSTDRWLLAKGKGKKRKENTSSANCGWPIAYIYGLTSCSVHRVTTFPFHRLGPVFASRSPREFRGLLHHKVFALLDCGALRTTSALLEVARRSHWMGSIFGARSFGLFSNGSKRYQRPVSTAAS